MTVMTAMPAETIVRNPPSEKNDPNATSLATVIRERKEQNENAPHQEKADLWILLQEKVAP